jgi:hypothetical protein
VTFSGSFFLLVFGLVQGNEKGWGPAEILACLAGALVLLALFLLVELRPWSESCSRSRWCAVATS